MLPYGIGNYSQDGNSGNEFCFEYKTRKLSNEEFRSAENLPEFDFENIWSYGATDNYQYPVLQIFERECKHEYGNWSVTKNPTCIEKGSKERTCTLCKTAKEVEDITMNPTAHSFTTPITTTQQSAKTEQKPLSVTMAAVRQIPKQKQAPHYRAAALPAAESISRLHKTDFFHREKTVYNTAIKKGTRYYYKVGGYVEYNDVKYYSG